MSALPIPGAPQAVDAAAEPRVVPMQGIRKIAADRLLKSCQTMAHVTVANQADVSGLRHRLEAQAPLVNEETGHRLTYTDLLVQSLAHVLPRHPFLNARLTDAGIELLPELNIGMAVAVDDGLLVPIIHDAGAMDLMGIVRRRVDLVQRAKASRLDLADVTGGTFTLTNPGIFGADIFTPIVNPPQSAILGVGAIKDGPAVVETEIVVRPMMWLSVTFDHRIVEGSMASQFISDLADHLANDVTVPNPNVDDRRPS
jgi:pyruvate dehydrogenase E2 component (dihydrolipoamide acetyltransferase)